MNICKISVINPQTPREMGPRQWNDGTKCLMRWCLACCSANMMVTLHSQYHSCWWPGDTRSQGMNRYGVCLFYRKIPVSSPEWLNVLIFEGRGVAIFSHVRVHVCALTLKPVFVLQPETKSLPYHTTTCVIWIQISALLSYYKLN